MRRIAQLSTTGFITALLLVYGVAFSTVHAATDTTPPESITLSPVNKHYKVDADSLKTDEMTIVNDGQVAYDFILYARPYSIHDEAYATPDFINTSSNSDVYKWIQFDQARYHIEPGQTIKAGYTMRVPKDTAPGGHYGVLFAETQPEDGQEGNIVARKKRVGMIIYATVNGQFRMSGRDLGSTIPFLQFRAPLTASSKVQNDGNSDFSVAAAYRVSDLFGNLKYSESKEFAVLPQTKRQMTFEWKSAPWFGLYRVNLATSFLDQKHSSEGLVLIAPRWLLIVLAVTLAGGVVYVVLRRRKR